MGRLPSSWSLDGRVAVVTGAGSASGIGFHTARLLGELGARVVVTSTTERIHERVDDLRGIGVEALGHVADLTEPDAAHRLVTVVSKWSPTVDVLVNNAGMTSIRRSMTESGESASLADIDLADFRQSIERNLMTTVQVTKALLPLVRRSQMGRVVVVSSVTGTAMAMRNEVAYAAAKAGLLGFVRSLALDEARYGITVNSVAPGWISTGSQTDHEHMQGLASPVGRSGIPEEVASIVAWLATPSAAYTTGQNFVVDGGNSIAEERSSRS